MKKAFFIFILIVVIILISLFFIFPFKKNEDDQTINAAQVSKLLTEEEKNNISFSSFFPIREEDFWIPQLGEKAGLVVLFSPYGKENILYEKNIEEQLPIASLTKIMTAMVVIDNYPLDKEVEISEKAIKTLGKSSLCSGEKMTVENLLNLALLVSSNDATSALAEIMGEERFVKSMNEKAKEIGLLNTFFVNPHGLDEDDHKNNISSAYDLAIMTQYSLLHYPKIWEILGKSEKNIIGYDSLGREMVHYARNVSWELLLRDNILGGKTGYTEDAGETMIVVMKAPGIVKGNIVMVILGVGIGERIPKSIQLYNWVYNAYKWE
ncbi:MAG: serine hydrolase [Minisyncoccales bacterium]